MSTNATIQLTEEIPFEVMKRSWQPVANSADLPMGKLVSYQLFDVDLWWRDFRRGCWRRKIAVRTKACG